MPADQTFLQLAAVEAAASGTIAKYIPQQAHIYLREACQKKKLQILRHCLKDGGEGSSQTPIRKKNLIET